MKTKKYWLRWGIWLGLVTVIFSLILTVADLGMVLPVVIIFPIYLFVAFPLGLLETFVFGHLLGSLFTSAFLLPAPTIIGSLLMVVFYFTLGSILGFVYGKIKNRKKISQS